MDPLGFPKLLLCVLVPGLGSLHFSVGQFDFLRPGSRAQHVKCGSLLIDLGLQLRAFGLVILVRQEGQKIALFHTVTFLDVNVSDNPFDPRANIGVLTGQDIELACDLEFQPADLKYEEEDNRSDELQRWSNPTQSLSAGSEFPCQLR